MHVAAIPAPRSRLRHSLRGCRLFCAMEEGELAEIERFTRRIRLQRGDHVWSLGQRADAFHVVLRGLVELRRPVGGFDATVMAIFGPRECPAVSVALTQGLYGADAVVVSEDAELLVIQAAPLIEWMRRDARLAMAINRALLAQMRLLHRKIDVMSAGTVPQRLGTFLLDLADRFGDEFEDGETKIPFSLSREQIAHYVNARVETVIRALSVWRKAGLVEFRRDAISLPQVHELERVLTS